MSRRGWLIFGALGLVWGLPYLFIKIAVADLAPPVIVFGRVFLGALVLIPVAWRSGALAAVRPKLRWVVAFALIEISGPWVLLTFAEQRVSSSLAALFISAVPLVGAVLAWSLRLDDRFDRQHLDARRRERVVAGEREQLGVHHARGVGEDADDLPGQGQAAGFGPVDVIGNSAGELHGQQLLRGPDKALVLDRGFGGHAGEIQFDGKVERSIRRKVFEHIQNFERRSAFGVEGDPLRQLDLSIRDSADAGEDRFNSFGRTTE